MNDALDEAVAGRSLAAVLANADGGAQSRALLTGWRPEGLPASSGCDSSDCAYCCALARLRQPGSSAASSGSCWLRRKRSRVDLAGLADAAAAGTPTSSCECCHEEGGKPLAATLSRVPSANTLAAVVPDAPVVGSSLWDHALLAEPQPAAGAEWRALPPAEQQQSPLQQQQQPQQQQSSQQQQRAAQHQPEQQRTRRREEEVGEDELGERPLQQERQQRRRLGSPSSSSSSSECSSGSLGSASRRSGGSSSAAASRPGSWHPSWHAPAALREVAAFHPPASRAGRTPGACSDIVCALEFEEHGWLLASAGVSKQVRVYSLASRLQHPGDEAYQRPLRCHRMPSKLSCLAWHPDAPGAVTVADYDGVVSQVDMESGHLIAEADEHGGRRVWSVSHSLQRPHLCASAAEDGVVRLWGGPGLAACVAALRPGAGGAPACGVHLSPFDANLAAVACADHSAYVYDLRRAGQPLWQLAGHERAVSYVRWLGPGRLATASTDASLAIWQLPGPQQADATTPPPAAAAAAAAGSQPAVLSQPAKRLRGHRNAKNFVGLSVRPGDGLLACGSEAPACITYHEAWASPLAVFGLGAGGSGGADGAPRAAGSSPQGQPRQPPPAAGADAFCSAVCWQPATARPAGAAPLLAAALSNGELRVLELQRPAASALQRRCLDG